MSDELPRTRTRLPVRAEEGALPARRRNPVLSGVGVVVVILVVMLTLAYASRRGGTDQEAGGTQPAGSAQNSAGVPAVAGGRDAGTVAGVAVGHPRTREGAQSAAANYATAYGSSAMFKPASRQALIAAIADPATKAGLLARADAAFAAQTTLFGLDAQGNAPKGLVFVCRALPVGTKPVSYTADSATVEVWGAGLVGLAGAGSTKPVSEAWSTTTMRLSWADGDWKLVDFGQKEGPTPVSGLQTASGAAEIAQAVRDFEELRYAR
ncbi:hypothetical protein [Yinghuangia soli]|uniref:Uncharacterized protein n=1 Tax=Yinghuangia soli TaxID=2908204 RepID=A0AA41U0V4_9ACTN|nr:hypothetical protein [Yinghuangia soli]MCF2526817.1 hypothetical protein [Yinghuangia soli]